ncbi:unnamed protein product [Didymodactylos carnosus]|uniref:Uncharacterized protein n=1 Tax=Didymodactylos carnosus TaxID=1234261 RepID=A0A813ZIQ8_9BILA|nr:unnamed protein product [Didymodactylos carnosus]CAF0950624.1 unnamed protein product [Didymodactylos carnosus]CAF3682160.1 unnamed protein product [Didymodactylos carnosus]CAF3724823.1 unnamed protein product [Didymodactylos carnosus]
MKPNEQTPLARSKIELVKFVCHQLHPFAYAVSTFLRPALDECQTAIHDDSVNTLDLLIQLAQTFIRTAPEPELIYDDIRKFAADLRSTIDECMRVVDVNQVKHPPTVIEETLNGLQSLVETAVEDQRYTTLYKNLSVLTNLERINSLPTENLIQLSSYAHNHRPHSSNSDRYSAPASPTTHGPQQPLLTTIGGTSTTPSFSNRHEIPHPTTNGHSNGSIRFNNFQFQQQSPPQPSQIINRIQAESPSSRIQHASSSSSYTEASISPSPLPSKFLNAPKQQQQLSEKQNLTSQVKNSLTASTSNFLNNRQEIASSYLDEYEITDTSKKLTTPIASFPPRSSSSSLVQSTYTNTPAVKTAVTTVINDAGYSFSPIIKPIVAPTQRQYIAEDHSEKNSIQKHPLSIDSAYDSQQRTTTSIPSERTEGYYEDIDNYEEEEKDFVDQAEAKQYYLQPAFNDPQTAAASYIPCKQYMSIIDEESIQNQSLVKNDIVKRHVTDDYLREWGTKRERPALRGNCFMIYGNQQNPNEPRRSQTRGSSNDYDQNQSSCLPIGVSLTNDDSTILSCDVHVNSNCVRLYDVQSGQLKHCISSTRDMKLSRPSAALMNLRDQIVIKERNHVYIVDSGSDTLLKTIYDRNSMKNLYGVCLYENKYLLTIDQQRPESARILLIDQDTAQIVHSFDFTSISLEDENLIRRKYSSEILHGRILQPQTSKLRFLAVKNDRIYISDLGRSLIYVTNIHGQILDHQFTFGGTGNQPGECCDPAGLIIDTAGNIINADSKNDRIQIYSSNGEYNTKFQLNEPIRRPSDICINRAGTQIFISCYLKSCVKGFDLRF